MQQPILGELTDIRQAIVTRSVNKICLLQAKSDDGKAHGVQLETFFGVYTQMELKNLPWEQRGLFQLFLKRQIFRHLKDPMSFTTGVRRILFYLKLKPNF